MIHQDFQHLANLYHRCDPTTSALYPISTLTDQQIRHMIRYVICGDQSIPLLHSIICDIGQPELFGPVYLNKLATILSNYAAYLYRHLSLDVVIIHNYFRS
jgi:hypothetical protein